LPCRAILFVTFPLFFEPYSLGFSFSCVVVRYLLAPALRRSLVFPPIFFFPLILLSLYSRRSGDFSPVAIFYFPWLKFFRLGQSFFPRSVPLLSLCFVPPLGSVVPFLHPRVLAFLPCGLLFVESAAFAGRFCPLGSLFFFFRAVFFLGVTSST